MPASQIKKEREKRKEKIRKKERKKERKNKGSLWFPVRSSKEGVIFKEQK